MDGSTNQRLGELIMELSQGKKEALSEIYEIMCRILYSVGNAYFSSRADVEDSIQDLLLALLYKAKTFKENTNACAWITVVYQNIIKGRLRRKKRENEYLKGEVEKYKVSANFSDADSLEAHVFIKDIFEKLTEYERNLLIYSYWRKCSLSEIGKILKKPKSTIEYQINAIKTKITKL